MAENARRLPSLKPLTSAPPRLPRAAQLPPTAPLPALPALARSCQRYAVTAAVGGPVNAVPRAAVPRRASSAPGCPRLALGCLASSGSWGLGTPKPRPRRCAPSGTPSTVLGLQPQKARGLRSLRAVPGIFDSPRPTRAPSPSSRFSPKRLALAAGGARAPVCPQGRPRTTPARPGGIRV